MTNDVPIPDAASPSPAAGLPRRRSRSRTWLFRLLAILLGLTPFLALEAGLRLCGIGRDLQLVVPCQNATGWFRLNPYFDEPFYGAVDLSGPHSQPFRLPKPRGVKRILVIGGSTVVGFPYTSELAFPRMMQEYLQSQCDTAETIEVLNAGISAMNTTTEVASVEEGLKADPDLIVVYTGHNEFYGPGGNASKAGWFSPDWHRAILKLRRLYTVQLLRRLTRRAGPAVELMEVLPGNVHIPFNGKLFQAGIARFQRNLDEMASTAGRAKVPILFVSPVSNEHDQPPIEDSKSPDSPSGPESWHARLQTCEREIRWGDAAAGLEHILKMREERDDDALVRFRLAQAYEKVEREDEAAAEFHSAVDYDGCRFRAPAAFRSAMAEVASRHAPLCDYLDLFELVCADSPQLVPGRKHFLEHVHFTWEGNQFVASAIAQRIWKQIWSRPWSGDRVPNSDTVGQRLAVLDEDHVAAHTVAMMFYQKAPFRNGADAEQLAKDLVYESMKIFQRLPIDQRLIFENLSSRQMADDLLSAMINASRTSRNDMLLLAWLTARVIRQPWRCDANSELADFLRSHNRNEDLERLRESAKAWPCAPIQK